MKQVLTEIRGEADNFTVTKILTALSQKLTGHTHKIRKNTDGLKNTINHHDPITSMTPASTELTLLKNHQDIPHDGP